MSQRLPVRPNLEHLKNQAKDLLHQLRRHDPDVALATAQHAIARQYGFASWRALKTHVASVTATAVPDPGTARTLAGRWRANLSRSHPHPSHPFRSAILEFDVRGDLVTITDVVVDGAGREERGTNALVVDGAEHPQPYGYVLVARWVGASALEAIVTKDGKVEGTVRYEVGPDGNTCTLSTGEQLTVFERE